MRLLHSQCFLIGVIWSRESRDTVKSARETATQGNGQKLGTEMLSRRFPLWAARPGFDSPLVELLLPSFYQYENHSVNGRGGLSSIEHEKSREMMHFKVLSLWTENQSQVEVTLNDASLRNFEQKRRSHFWMSNTRNFSRAIKFDYLGS